MQSSATKAKSAAPHKKDLFIEDVEDADCERESKIQRGSMTGKSKVSQNSIRENKAQQMIRSNLTSTQSYAANFALLSQ